MKKTKRNFIIVYVGSRPSEQITGNWPITCIGFPSWRKVAAEIEKDMGIKSIVITNIIEISDDDMNDWVARD